ncbi:hypothetical protein M409DRAFT_67893 [Zasmidium cellare ATCC 36951]|uniref:Major facilitator superfamily (MFS) profile domain-containing protein n=1 Tax=Zasmidium cellare ATCC 36951 TaxID=1080233 RepID=A0A6A6CDX4_ZASCE|nr:uncharacterized protein M409DRAFT_67893 [Zasmidium cellare ATCC 36951]KAF2164378.1 hypothetical protein M409DRAFT_67893 [Zasmidium cellare ATCC 36951]
MSGYTSSRPSSDANVEAPSPPPPQQALAGPTPPPNGGLTAWMQAFLLLIMGVFAGPIYDRGYLRLLLISGAFLVVFGHMMLSLCHAYWEIILAQGVVIGVGTGLLFVPCVAINAQYFSTRLGLAVGIATAGSSLGGVIYPIVLYRLINEIGFAWAVRIEGFLALATLLIPLALLKLRVKPPKVRAIIDWSAFVDVQFMSFVLSGLIAYMGIFVFFFYVAYYSQDQHFLGTAMSFYVVPIFNAASCFGRSLPNALADKTGSFNLLAPGTFLAGVFMLCFMAVSSGAGIIVLAIFTGFISGVMIGMPPLCFVAMTPDKSKLGTRIGMGYAIMGFGILAGGPGGGGILGDKPPLDWTGIWTFGGVSACVAGLGFWGVRVIKFGWKVNKKA